MGNILFRAFKGDLSFVDISLYFCMVLFCMFSIIMINVDILCQSEFAWSSPSFFESLSIFEGQQPAQLSIVNIASNIKSPSILAALQPSFKKRKVKCFSESVIIVPPLFNSHYNSPPALLMIQRLAKCSKHHVRHDPKLYKSEMDSINNEQP